MKRINFIIKCKSKDLLIEIEKAVEPKSTTSSN